MRKTENISGRKFGRLTAIEREKDHIKPSGQSVPMWKCECDCGSVIITSAYSLTSGKTKSCGCSRRAYAKSKLEDLTGKRFGKLLVVKQGEYKTEKGGKRKSTWECACDCGNNIIATTTALKSGNTKSCGCLKNEKTSERFLKDITGKRFFRLTVLGRAENKGKKTRWLCRCDCGNEIIVSGSDLVSGNTMSCGCYHREKLIDMNTTHGMTGTRIYGLYCGIKERCYNENSEHYKDYGGRGIVICHEWLGEHGFENFSKWAYSTGYDENAERGECTIERKDVNGNYEPSNCTWANLKTQANNKRNNRLIECNGEMHTLSEWAEITKLNCSTILYRINKMNWSAEKALSTPARKMNRKK